MWNYLGYLLIKDLFDIHVNPKSYPKVQKKMCFISWGLLWYCFI